MPPFAKRCQLFKYYHDLHGEIRQPKYLGKVHLGYVRLCRP